MMIYGKKGFSKDILNWSKMTVKTFTLLKKIYFTKSDISEVSRDTEDLSNGFRKFSFASQK